VERSLTQINYLQLIHNIHILDRCIIFKMDERDWYGKFSDTIPMLHISYWLVKKSIGNACIDSKTIICLFFYIALAMPQYSCIVQTNVICGAWLKFQIFLKSSLNL
jgi:hypothetical protein